MIKKHEANPLIEPESIKPSRDGYRVKGAFNAGAAEYNDGIILLLRVAEDCVAGEGFIAVPCYRFDAEGGHPEILEVKADDPRVRLKDTRGAAPIKTDKGWLEIYHGKGKDQIYSLYLLLLDLNDPSRVLKRGNEPILFPEEPADDIALLVAGKARGLEYQEYQREFYEAINNSPVND